jgi:hypothetical protein
MIRVMESQMAPIINETEQRNNQANERKEGGGIGARGAVHWIAGGEGVK